MLVKSGNILQQVATSGNKWQQLMILISGWELVRKLNCDVDNVTIGNKCWSHLCNIWQQLATAGHTKGDSTVRNAIKMTVVGRLIEGERKTSDVTVEIGRGMRDL